jgi:nucleoside-diphosphate kinase
MSSSVDVTGAIELRETFLMEATLVLVKPDALQRGLAGEILLRIERKGLSILGLKMFQFTEDLLKQHYAHHLDAPFFPELAEFMTSGPSVAVCVGGVDAVSTVRQMCGITKARDADPGTIRGDLAMSVQRNLVHASDSPSAAEQELSRFFLPHEIISAVRALDPFLHTAVEREG